MARLVPNRRFLLSPAAESLLTLSNQHTNLATLSETLRKVPLQEFRDLNPTQLEAAQVAIRKIIEGE